MIYGYARVSTKGQARDGNSLEEQERLLRQNGAEVIFIERGITGKKKERPEFTKLLGELTTGDTLMVTKQERVASSVSWANELIEELIDKGVTVNVLNLGVLNNSSMSTLFRQILLAFAEFERNMIYERTSEGKAVKRQNEPDWKEGRPKKIAIPQKLIAEVSAGEKSISAACRELGISRTSWYNNMTR